MNRTRRMGILVVDHGQHDVRPLSTVVTETYGPRVAVDAVVRGNQAVAHLKSVAYDLILIDRWNPESGRLVALLESVDGDVPIVGIHGAHPGVVPGVEGRKHETAGLGPQLCRLIDRLLDRPCRECRSVPADDALRPVLESSLDGILVIDEERRAVFSNGAAGSMFGYEADELLGTPVDFPVRNGKVSELVLPTGRVVEMQVVPVPWEGKQAHLATLRDITRRKAAEAKVLETTEKLQEANERLQALADVDPLTSLLNRRGLASVVKDESLDQRDDSKAMMAMLVDCDDFKAINDRFDHVAGDAVLRTIAQRLDGAIRPTDRLARVGGDEFLILLPNTRMQEALKVAERIRRVVNEEAVPLPGHPMAIVYPSVSIGVASPPKTPWTLEHLVARADEALKHSKVRGKNRVSGHVPPVSSAQAAVS